MEPRKYFGKKYDKNSPQWEASYYSRSAFRLDFI